MTDPVTSNQQASPITSITTTVDASTSTRPETVVRIKLKKPKCKKAVAWTQDTVDNEDMNKKKSKVCCIYHKPRPFGESSSESSDDDNEGDTGKHQSHHDHNHDNNAYHDVDHQTHGNSHVHFDNSQNISSHVYHYHDQMIPTTSNREADAEIISRSILTSTIDKIDLKSNPFRALKYPRYERGGHSSDSSDS